MPNEGRSGCTFIKNANKKVALYSFKPKACTATMRENMEHVHKYSMLLLL